MRKSSKIILALLLALPLLLGAALPSLDGLGIEQLEELRQQTDARIRQLQLADPQGYVDVLDGESYARAPQEHPAAKVKLSGELLQVKQTETGFDLSISLNSNPARVFVVHYQPAADQRQLLPGDLVTAFGTYEGLAPFTGEDPFLDGAPRVTAELVTPQVVEAAPLAAPPHAGTREDPVTLGIKATYRGNYWTDYATFEMTMTEVSRGSAAQKRTRSMSSYNLTPPRGQEYFLVWFNVKAIDAPNGRANISAEDFYFVSATGAEYRHHFLINSPQTLRNLYEGGEHTAIIACLIDKDDVPMVVYQPESSNPLWFNPNAPAEGQ